MKPENYKGWLFYMIFYSVYIGILIGLIIDGLLYKEDITSCSALAEEKLNE